jgi:hypothetical protein
MRPPPAVQTESAMDLAGRNARGLDVEPLDVFAFRAEKGARANETFNF